MICQKCGSPVAEGEKFCQNCGAAQAPVAVAQPAAKTTAPIYDIIVYASVALTLIGLMMPVISAGAMGISMSFGVFDGMLKMAGCDLTIWGLLIIVGGVGTAVLYALNYDKFLWVGGAVTALSLIMIMVTFASKEMLVSGVSIGLGYFIMWLGAILSIALPFAAKPLEPYIGTRKIYIKK